MIMISGSVEHGGSYSISLVLATATRQSLVFTVVFAMFVTKGQQLGITRVPINLIPRKMTC